ncbi:MAG TPA: phosphotransferase [Trebonia sp.]|nr:phosphotransferase [Trebonia sp.]
MRHQHGHDHMTPGDPAHDLSAGGDVLDRVTACARQALAAHDVGPGASITLLNVSENATFLVTGPDGDRSVLRVHRLGYHGRTAIESEHAWMGALRAEAGIRTPRVLAAVDGRPVVEAAGRHCVRFEFLPGTEPAGAADAPAAMAHFAELGAITARMHAHARRWQRPGWFTRFSWGDDDAFGAGMTGAPGRWGSWRDALGVGAAETPILRRLENGLRRRLAAFGASPERFGLIHADTRLANLLVHDGATAVIDFDDSGFGWYLYDLGTAVSFFEDDPAVPGLVAAWLDGYQRTAVMPLMASDIAEAWTFVLFRRLLLTAWIGSHPAAADAAALGADYTRGTCDLAERYLSGQLSTKGF